MLRLDMEAGTQVERFVPWEEPWPSVQFSLSVVSKSLWAHGLQAFFHPDLPVHHQLSDLLRLHVHCVGDAIQPSHPLSSPSPPSFTLSWHQGLFQWVGSLHQVAKVKYWSFSFSISPPNEQVLGAWHFSPPCLHASQRSTLMHHLSTALLSLNCSLHRDMKDCGTRALQSPPGMTPIGSNVSTSFLGEGDKLGVGD